jgi:RNA polymerase sigma factor (sigma-70 family)
MVARWNEPILALASRLTGDHEEAQDLRQMALLKLYQGIEDFEGRSRFSTWIYRMVLNLSRDRARARASRLRAFAGLVNERLGRTSAIPGSHPAKNGSAAEPALEETGFRPPTDARSPSSWRAQCCRCRQSSARSSCCATTTTSRSP